MNKHATLGTKLGGLAFGKGKPSGLEHRSSTITHRCLDFAHEYVCYPWVPNQLAKLLSLEPRSSALTRRHLGFARK